MCQLPYLMCMGMYLLFYVPSQSHSFPVLLSTNHCHENIYIYICCFDIISLVVQVHCLTLVMFPVINISLSSLQNQQMMIWYKFLKMFVQDTFYHVLIVWILLMSGLMHFRLVSSNVFHLHACCFQSHRWLSWMRPPVLWMK